MQDKLRWIKTFTFALVFIQSTLSSASVFSVTPKAGTTLPIELMSNSSHAADGTTPYTYNGCGYQDASGGTGQTIANYTPVALTASSNRCTYCALTKKQAAAPVTVTSNTATATVNSTLATTMTNPSNTVVDSGQTATVSTVASSETERTIANYTPAALATSNNRYTYCTPAKEQAITPTVNSTLATTMTNSFNTVVDSGASGKTAPYTYRVKTGLSLANTSRSIKRTTTHYTKAALTTSSNRHIDRALAKKRATAPIIVASNTATPTVNIALAATNPSNTTVDSGQTAAFSAAAFGGTAPYAYRVKTSLANMNRGVRQTTTHYTKATLTTSSNRYTYRAPVTDSAAVKKTSFSTAWLHPVVTVTGGLAIASIGQSNTSIPVELCLYHYDPSPVHSTQPLWGGFLGNETHLSSSWAVDLGVGYYQPAAFAGAGTLIQGADVHSYNYYRYSYQVSTKQLLLEGKLLGRIKERVHPYLSLGAGATFNRNYLYETSMPPFFSYTPLFDNDSQTNFSYTLGVGVDFNVDKEWRIGAGYRFTSLGRANFGSATIDAIPISGTLKQSYLYTNEALIQLTYVPSMG